jgi:hypothetical protein
MSHASIKTEIMVDYSKWDRMEFSSESDSEEGGSNNDEDENTPRVTSLNQPGRVTISADGTIQIVQSSPSSPGSSSTEQQQRRRQDNSCASDFPVVSGSVSGNTVDISSLPSAKVDDKLNNNKIQEHQIRREQLLTRNGGRHTTTVDTNQTQIRLPIYWSQDRYIVTLRLGFPTSQFPSKTIRVKVLGALKYEDRHSAVGSGSMMTDYISKHQDGGDDDSPSFGSVKIVSVSNDNNHETVLFNGLLPRPIHLNQDEQDVEYEIEDAINVTTDKGVMNKEEDEAYCDRFVSIIMPKAVPMHGMILWWDRPMVGFPKINVALIQDRNIPQCSSVDGDAKCNSSRNIHDIEKKEAFQKAWAEAHEMFREKMKKQEKLII